MSHTCIYVLNLYWCSAAWDPPKPLPHPSLNFCTFYGHGIHPYWHILAPNHFYVLTRNAQPIAVWNTFVCLLSWLFSFCFFLPSWESQINISFGPCSIVPYTTEGHSKLLAGWHLVLKDDILRSYSSLCRNAVPQDTGGQRPFEIWQVGSA